MDKKCRLNIISKTKISAHKILFSLVSCLLIGAAGDLIINPGFLHAGVLSSGETSDAGANPEPLSITLEKMDSRDRSNSFVELESLDSTDRTLQNRLNRIARLWNRGDTSAAIRSLQKLEERNADFALGISWLSPPDSERTDGGAISAHSSSFNVHLDYHKTTGNIFAAIQDTESSYHWRVFLSTNGGSNWSETYSWGATIPIVDIGAAVIGDYFYVTYVTENTASAARIRRSLITTGAVDSTFNWLEVFDIDDAIVSDVELTSNQEVNNNRLYLFSILSDGRLISYFTDEEGGSDPDMDWTELDTGVTDAVNVLDLAYNDRDPAGTPGGYLFAVYQTVGNKVNVFRFIYPFPAKDVTEIAPYFHSNPRISVYRHHAVVVYGSDNSTSVGANVAISADSGDTWSWEILDGGIDGDVSQPVVTLRGGGGVAVGYQRNLPGDDLPFIRAGHYEDLPLSSPAAASDTGLSLGSRMDLEALPEGGLGLVSIHDGGIPYFDRTPILFMNGFELGDTLDWD